MKGTGESGGGSGPIAIEKPPADSFASVIPFLEQLVMILVRLALLVVLGYGLIGNALVE